MFGFGIALAVHCFSANEWLDDFDVSEVSRLKFKAAVAFANSGCLKTSWFFNLAIPLRFCLSFLDSWSMRFFELLVTRAIDRSGEVSR